MRIILPIGALGAAMLLAAAPAMAQTHDGAAGHDMKGHDMKGHDMKGHDMKGTGSMSEADRTKMASCNAMSHADAMKDAGCAALMKAHPQGMNHKPKTM